MGHPLEWTLFQWTLFHQFGDGGSEFVGFEAEGAGLAFVGDAPAGVNEVKAIGPAGVCLLGRVAKFIEHRREFDAQLAYARSCHKPAFFFTPGAGKDDLILDVALHLPDVAGMGFEDVDHEEGDFAVVVVVELVQGRNLPPEGRSRVAAKHQYDGLLRGQGRKLYSGGLVELEQVEVGGGVAEPQFSGARVGPCGLKGKQEKGGRARHVRHDAGEFLGRLLHRPADVASEGDIQHEHSNHSTDQPGFLRDAHPHGSDIVPDGRGGRL